MTHFVFSSPSSLTAVSKETHTIIISAGLGSSLHSLGADPTENSVSIVISQQYLDCCLFVAAGKFLPSRYLAMNVYFDSATPAFGRHVKICMYTIIIRVIQLKLV
jgi:hypothetical protein